MEHKLIQGGEQYLPFARNRIKALRATGLRYASQRFEVDGASIQVRIADDQDYIILSGGDEGIFSGVTRQGVTKLVDLPKSGMTTVLRDYKPTTQAWEFQLKRDGSKSPGKFSDEPRLAIGAATALNLSTPTRPSATQYNGLCSSMYSGLMKKAVQIILGYGKPKASGITTDGVQVQYDFRWKRCHGIATGADGKFWLLEISQDNGVLLMALALQDGSQRRKNSQLDAVRHAVRLFGGLPTGATFPKAQALLDALERGTVLQLLKPDEMAGYFDKSAYSPTMGWSFNDDGSEAHNTCWYIAAGDQPRGCHYKLSITIGEVDPERADGEPVVPASATLSLAAEGSILRGGSFSVPTDSSTGYATNPCAFYDAVVDYFQAVPGWRGIPTASIPEHKTPVFVCHIDNQLEIVYSEFRAINDIGVQSGLVTNPDGSTEYLSVVLADGVTFGTCASSTRYPATPVGQSESKTRRRVLLDTTITGYQATETVFYRVVREQVRQYDDDFTGDTRWTPSAAIWPEGTRDCYVFFQPEVRSGVRPGGMSQDYFYTTLIPISKAEYDGLPKTAPSVPAEAPPGNWDYTDRLAAYHIVLSEGQLLDVELPSNTSLATQARWGVFGPLNGYRFIVRHSTFGNHKQLVCTDNPMRIDPNNTGLPPPLNVKTQLKLTGSMLDSEPYPADRTDYSFIGYI